VKHPQYPQEEKQTVIPVSSGERKVIQLNRSCVIPGSGLRGRVVERCRVGLPPWRGVIKNFVALVEWH